MKNLSKWIVLISLTVASFPSDLLTVQAPSGKAGPIHSVQDRYKRLSTLEILKRFTPPKTESAAEPKPPVAEATPSPEPVVITAPLAPEQPEKPKGRTITMAATAYTISKEQTGNTKGKTFTGTTVTKHRTVSVDPKVIPLGSLLYITSNSDLVAGYYVAEDTGSAIHGKILDVFMGWGGKGAPDWNEAMKFGRRNVEVTVVREGYERK